MNKGQKIKIPVEIKVEDADTDVEDFDPISKNKSPCKNIADNMERTCGQSGAVAKKADESPSS